VLGGVSYESFGAVNVEHWARRLDLAGGFRKRRSPLP